MVKRGTGGKVIQRDSEYLHGGGTVFKRNSNDPVSVPDSQQTYADFCNELLKLFPPGGSSVMELGQNHTLRRDPVHGIKTLCGVLGHHFSDQLREGAGRKRGRQLRLLPDYCERGLYRGVSSERVCACYGLNQDHPKRKMRVFGVFSLFLNRNRKLQKF